MTSWLNISSRLLDPSPSLILPSTSGRFFHYQGGLFFKFLYYILFCACLLLLSLPSERCSMCHQCVPCYSCRVFHCMNKPHIIYPIFLLMNFGIFPVLIVWVKLLWICPFGELIQSFLFGIHLRESLLDHRGGLYKDLVDTAKKFSRVFVCVYVWVYTLSSIYLEVIALGLLHVNVNANL